MPPCLQYQDTPSIQNISWTTPESTSIAAYICAGIWEAVLPVGQGHQGLQNYIDQNPYLYLTSSILNHLSPPQPGWGPSNVVTRPGSTPTHPGVVH